MKLTKIENKIISTYDYEHGFYIEITKESDGVVSAWLCHEEQGIKKYMFGSDIKIITETELLELVERNIEQYTNFFEI